MTKTYAVVVTAIRNTQRVVGAPEPTVEDSMPVNLSPQFLDSSETGARDQLDRWLVQCGYIALSAATITELLDDGQ